MEPQNVALCAAVFLTLRKRRVRDIERRRRLRARRRTDFRQIQSRQCMFAFLLSMASLTIQSPVRSVWMKPRSNTWCGPSELVEERIFYALQVRTRTI